MSHTVDILPELESSLRKFRFAKRQGNSVLIAKVNKQKLIVEEVEQLTNVDVDELGEELPESSPRFVVLSYETVHKDGRRSFPLVLINWVPRGSETGMMTLHASIFIPFSEIADANKVIEIRDGSEGLSKAIIDEAVE
ncbi:hypothetical protein FRB94_004396 [Tulasnella sp. JGI-2019a]|nr:hypothetical protein FRB94_004396 [Tulasnella sp. JGI-2019a]